MNSKRLAILILINFLVACSINKANSESQPKSLDVVFFKAIDNTSIHKVEYSENGQSILVAGAYGSARILDGQNFKTTATFEFSGSLANARLIENGQKLFVANQDGLVQIWDVTAKKLLFTHRFPQGEKHADTSIDMNYIGYGGFIYNKSSGELLTKPVTHAVQSALKFYDINNVLSSGYRDQRVILRNITNKTQQIWQTESPITTATNVKNFIIAGTDHGDCYVWGVSSKEPSHIIKGSGRINLITVHPRKSIFAVTSNNTTNIYSLNPFKKMLEIESTSLIRAVAISSNGIVALGEERGMIQLWDLNESVLIGKYNVKNDAVTTLSISPKNRDVVAGTNNGQIFLLRNN